MASQAPKILADCPDPEEMLTPKEFAKTKKVSISWLAKARKRGDGPPFVRFGRSIRYFPVAEARVAHHRNGDDGHGIPSLLFSLSGHSIHQYTRAYTSIIFVLGIRI